jgi:hypothetical protein
MTTTWINQPVQETPVGTVWLIKDLDARRFLEFPSGLPCHEDSATPFPSKHDAYGALLFYGLRPDRHCITSRLRRRVG